jgi:CubicO group peptidase (beta-lactamase class C family)
MDSVCGCDNPLRWWLGEPELVRRTGALLVRLASLFIISVLLVSMSFATVANSPVLPEEDDYPALTARLDVVREALGIPGMAAALVKDEQLVWAQGFGYADIENSVEATPHTPFGLASVTKPVAATLIMQLVEDGLIDLDAPIADYGVTVPEGPAVTVRHLLTHTSEGVPGETHSYNGNRYALLGGVIEGATGRTFSDLIGARILLPVGMTDTALNPINQWGGSSVAGFEDFARALGWGDSFRHYPDVYRRLASPYQFDSQYEIIPGMYHLSHSPAAGMMSSVADLAAFDIALGRGELLSDAARSEMFAPAVPTIAGSSDNAYGLGWYVQEWAGHHMVWHTGRWPPSTSALYLKLPDEGITFIVLANTDNLTTPFPMIGSGDLSHSTLMLTLFEQLIFDVPVIDWTSDRSSLIEELSQVEDPETRLFLELELWSYRQALASAGNHEQAAVLQNVDRVAFPGSSLRLDDSFTHTVPLMPEISPVISAASVATIAYAIMVWLLLCAISLIVMVFLLLRPTRAPAADWVVAIPAAVVLGPFAVLAVVLNRTAESKGSSRQLGRSGLAAVLSMTGYSLAWIVALAILVGGNENPNPLLLIGSILLLPFLVGLFLVRVPSLRKSGGLGLGRAVRAAAFPELMTLVLGVGVLFATSILVDNAILSTLPEPTSPYGWGMISAAALVGVLFLTPYYLVLQRRGMVSIPSLARGGGQAGPALRLPRWRDSWWLFLADAAVALALVALVGSRYG